MEEIVLKEEDVPGAHFSKDPAQYSVSELQRWLACHGQKKAGKKQELIERVRGCMKINTKVVLSIDDGKWYNIKKQKSKTATSKVSNHTLQLPSNGWKHFPSINIPALFNYGHTYHYLVESIAQFGCATNSDSDSGTDNGYTTTAKPLRKGRQLVNSGFVVDTQDCKDEEHYFLRGHVHHSMKSELPLDVSVVLSNASGFVVQASCSCKAKALSRCVHVAALLLSLVDFTQKNGHCVTTPSTSKPCVWNRGKKRAKNPKPLHKAQYKAKKFDDGRIYNWDPRPKKYSKDISEGQINNFIIHLQNINANNEESMWQTSLRIAYKDYELQEDRKIVLQDLVVLLEESLQPKRSTQSDTLNSAVEIPETQQQSQSTAWFQERQYRITASKCKEVCLLGDKLISHKGKEYVQKYFNWISKNFWSPKFIQTKDMQYGIEEEPKARVAYAEATGNQVRETGLWVNKRFPYLGASPDGLFTGTDGKDGVIEIKCLKILREQSVDDLIQQHKYGKLPSNQLSNQCFTISNDSLKLRESHPYYFQIQLQLLVTDLNFCDFVLYSPKGPPSVQRIMRDGSLLYRLRQSLSAFWHKVLSPEIFEMRIPRNLHPFIV